VEGELYLPLNNYIVVKHDSWWVELKNSSITADSVLAPIMRTREEWRRVGSSRTRGELFVGGSFCTPPH
jgi:hypothetical protein